MSVDGDIQVDLPLCSLTLDSSNIGIKFDEADEDDFIHTVSDILNKIKDYLFMNSNQIMQENKEIMRKFHE